MDDGISGGNGFQEYLMEDSMKRVVGGLEGKWTDQTDVFGEGVHKKVPHLQKKTDLLIV